MAPERSPLPCPSGLSLCLKAELEARVRVQAFGLESEAREGMRGREGRRASVVTCH